MKWWRTPLISLVALGGIGSVRFMGEPNPIDLWVVIVGGLVGALGIYLCFRLDYDMDECPCECAFCSSKPTCAHDTGQEAGDDDSDA